MERDSPNHPLAPGFELSSPWVIYLFEDIAAYTYFYLFSTKRAKGDVSSTLVASKSSKGFPKRYGLISVICAIY